MVLHKKKTSIIIISVIIVITVFVIGGYIISNNKKDNIQKVEFGGKVYEFTEYEKGGGSLSGELGGTFN